MRSRTLPAALLGATLLLAGCAGGDDTGDAAAGDDAATGDAAAGGSSLTVTGLDTLEWDPESLEAEAGEIAVELVCEPGVNHDLEIDGEPVAECDPGQTATGTIELDAGEYEFVCTVPGHEERMRGELTVE